MRFLLSAVLVATLALPGWMVQEVAAATPIKPSAKKAAPAAKLVVKYPPNTYGIYEECEAALLAGKPYYAPTYFGDAKKKPRKPIAYTRGNEADACAKIKVAGGLKRWVIEKAGTLHGYMANNEVVNRTDCGNDTDEIRYPKAKQAEAPLPRPALVVRPTPPPPTPPAPAATSPTPSPSIIKVEQEGEGPKAAVVITGSGDNTVNIRQEIKKVSERVQPVPPKQDGLSTGAKVGIAAVIIGVVTAAGIALAKSNKKTTEPAKTQTIVPDRK